MSTDARRLDKHAWHCMSIARPKHGCDCGYAMQLPDGKTCGNCENIVGCAALFGCKPTNVTCDWSPSRFQEGGA